MKIVHEFHCSGEWCDDGDRTTGVVSAIVDGALDMLAWAGWHLLYGAMLGVLALGCAAIAGRVAYLVGG